jgi:hypothetical protein
MRLRTRVRLPPPPIPLTSFGSLSAPWSGPRLRSPTSPSGSAPAASTNLRSDFRRRFIPTFGWQAICPELSVGVHGMDLRLCLTKTPTIHDLLARRRRGQLPASTPCRCATGVLLGVLGKSGVSMPWGYRQQASSPPWLPRHSRCLAPSLARTPALGQSLPRCASLAADPS